ncbi:unnamed protein product [Cladocopium goreaui]|uniref:Uncharacterized protein n=1 Tax=Cladocopium goreaui TaxID=2562237 RepID=A0A9P1BWB9_9DINO|nr:unnamed protein product [Cladocopium goreaui]
MLDPVNSGGDLFRLLPLEAYFGVLSFFPVQWLQSAAQVSAGSTLRYVERRTTEYDASVTCNSSEFKGFCDAVTGLSRLVTAISLRSWSSIRPAHLMRDMEM